MAVATLLLRDVGLLQGSAPEAVAALAAQLSLQEFARRQVLYEKGSRGSDLFFVVAGRLQAVDHTVDAREVGLYFVDPGQHFGEMALFGQPQREETMIALGPAKVLRLPGCLNWKNPQEPKVVRVVHDDPEARFNLIDLDDVLPPLDHKQKLWAGVEQPAVTVQSTTAVVVDAGTTVPPELLQGLTENHPLFRATWNHERQDLSDQSCSGYDLALAGIGVACGLTDQHITDLLVHHRREFPRHKQDRRGSAYRNYLSRTIGRARDGKQSSESAAADWDQLQADIDNSATVTTDRVGDPDHHEPPLTAVSGGAQTPPVRVPEANPSGRNGPPSPPQKTPPSSPIQFIVAKVRASGNVALIYENIKLFAALSQAELAIAYQDLKSTLGSRLNANHFNKAVKEARATLDWNAGSNEGQDPRPIIRTDSRLLDQIAREAVDALEAANDPPVLFRRGGALVMIRPDEDDHPVITRVSEAMMRGRLARVARFHRETKGGIIQVSPPTDLTLDVLSAQEGSFPALGVVSQLPIIHSDGSVRVETGYDPATRAYYLPEPSFQFPGIPTAPTANQIDTALKTLDEAIGDFPFESESDKANCIGLMLTPILKVGLNVRSPLALVDAPKWGTGKTLLAMLIYIIATGSEGTVCSAPVTEEEWRKRILSILERGSAVVILDNVDQTLRSPSLAAVLTSPYWEDRVLGRSEDVRLPNVATWIATGNNLALGGEMARRGYRIRLDAKVANPAQRNGFKRTDQELLDWARGDRGALVAALLVLIRAWWVADRPKAALPAFGSFNHWAAAIGGILNRAGVHGFLENLDQVQKEGDEESTQWDEFLRALVLSFGGCEFTAADVTGEALSATSRIALALPDEIGHPREQREGGHLSLARKVGRALARKCGTRFGDLDLRIERGEPEKHTKVQRWRVAGNVNDILDRD